MSQKITDTALLKCSQGTTESYLTVTSQDFDFIEDKLTATEEDKKPHINIKTFGNCYLQPSNSGFLPCTPSPLAWQKTTDIDCINDAKLLLTTSTCQCTIGGLINVKDKGYIGNHSGE